MCALMVDGTVQCWGDNSAGQLGTGSSAPASSTTPLTVTGLSGVTHIAAGEFFTCAVLTDKTMKCWGINAYGQSGDGTTTTYRYSPVSTLLISGVQDMDGSFSHTCAFLYNGTRYCWGNNASGAIGDGTVFVDSFKPKLVAN